MHDQPDAQLLRDYAEHGTEAAFREIVVRHTTMVYSSALRQVSSPDLARDVAQSVFTDLARKAKTLAATLDENASLLGWLFRSTRYAALNQLRDDRRRQARERQVMQDLNPASEIAPEWESVKPILDEAMAGLSDEDRDALLLRYFKEHDFRAIGATLGVSDDAAQKRVSRALERLRELLINRGVTTSALALSTTLSANAISAVPTGLAATISTAALAGMTSAAITTASTIKTIAMTTLQKTLITGTLVVAVGAGIYEARQASTLRTKVQSLEQQQQSAPANQTQQLTRERDEAKKQFAESREEIERLNRNTAELIRLRGEVARLRGDAYQMDDSTQVAMKSWVKRVAQLKERLKQRPDISIPELELFKEEDWLGAVKDRQLDSDNDYRLAFSALRYAAENKFAPLVRSALQKFTEANSNQFPTDMMQLREFFDPPVSDEILNHWQIAPSSTVPNVKMGGDQIITEKSVVDEVLDSRFAIGKNGYGSGDFLSYSIAETMKPVREAFQNANGEINWAKFDFSQYLPYATTSEQKAAVQKLIEQQALRK